MLECIHSRFLFHDYHWVHTSHLGTQLLWWDVYTVGTSCIPDDEEIKNISKSCLSLLQLRQKLQFVFPPQYDDDICSMAGLKCGS